MPKGDYKRWKTGQVPVATSSFDPQRPPTSIFDINTSKGKVQVETGKLTDEQYARAMEIGITAMIGLGELDYNQLRPPKKFE